VPGFRLNPSIRDKLASKILQDDTGDYVPRAGMPSLRASLASSLSGIYQANIFSENILITNGANQAYCAAISALAAPGDEVILAVPYYFNHHSWLHLQNIKPIYLHTYPTLVPNSADADRLVTKRTKAIVVTTPGNPTGVTIPAPVVLELYKLAKRHGIALILDETYRAFSTETLPHLLFQQPNWGEHVISLYSFSKEHGMPGYRVGAAIASPYIINAMMKFSESVAVCAPRIGQEAALAVLESKNGWRVSKIEEVRKKRELTSLVFATDPGGFHLESVGAIYGWLYHPFRGEPTIAVVKRLALELGIFALPGTIFTDTDTRALRICFAGQSATAIEELGPRLRSLRTK